MKLKKRIKLGNHIITNGSKPFIIAEISSNHKQKFSSIIKLINEIKKCGADAVKIQTYTEDTMTINSNRREFKITKGTWKGFKLYDLYKIAKTPLDWHKKIFQHCKKINLLCFSTPFDETSVDFLENFKVPIYKIASYEITDLPLIEYVANKKKPVIISTGMANLNEIEKAVKTFKKTGNNQLTLLHCVSNYPASHKDYNMRTMVDLKKKFDCLVGVSDHTENNYVAITATTLGANFIEKHVKLNDDNVSQDSKFSMDIKNFKIFCTQINEVYNTLGKIDYAKKNEKNSILHRRSIYVVKDIKKNDKFSKFNIRRVRPNIGLPPERYYEIIGKRARISIKKFQPLKKKHILTK